MSEITVLYMHGLGATDLRKNERKVLERNQRNSFNLEVADIDWQKIENPETFLELLGRLTQQATVLLEAMDDAGRLLLQGSSAGGSLAFNIAGQIDDARVRAVSHSGRLTSGRYPRWHPRSLEHCAHLGTNRASQSFYDSVRYFENTTATLLTDEQKQRMLITKPWADQVVPVGTMIVEGIRAVTVPAFGHATGIGIGMLRIPSLAEVF